MNIGSNTSPETFTFSNNLWYAHDDPSASQPTLPVAETDPVVSQDPGLDSDFGITSSSPAAGAGATYDGLVGDYDGDCWNSPPSIGAQEVQ